MPAATPGRRGRRRAAWRRPCGSAAAGSISRQARVISWKSSTAMKTAFRTEKISCSMRRRRSLDSTRSISKWVKHSFWPSVEGAADPHDALPLAAHREDRVDGREDAQARLAEVVLEAVEDEGHVGGVGLHHRGLARQHLPPAPRRRLFGTGIRRLHVDAGEPLVELGRGRDLAGHETEVGEQARGQHFRPQAQDETVGHLLEHHRGQGEHEVAVLRSRLRAQHLEGEREA